MSRNLAATSVVPLYAGFWRRAAAAVVDSFVLFIPNVAVALLLPDGAIEMAAQLMVGLLYYALMHASEGQATLGKKAFGIKVTDLEGNRISIARAIGRVFGVWLSGLLLGIGLVMVAFTKRKQGLHDLISGTLVVARDAAPQDVEAGGDTMPLTGGVWAVVVLLLILPFFGGILAAIAIPAYQDYIVRAKLHEVINAAAPLKRQVETAHSQKQPWKTGPVPIQSAHARGAEVTPQGAVIVSLADSVVPNGRIHFTPTDAGGTVEWKCAGKEIAAKYLPQACR